MTPRPRQSVHELNARRRQSVELRLQGLTLAQTHERTGLSTPTIIAAMKAFRSGGWPAVDVGERGRPRRPADEHALQAMRQRFISQAGRSLWNAERVAQWMTTQQHAVGTDAAQALLKKWQLWPDNRYRTMRRNQPSALEPHDTFARKARQRGALVVWLSGRHPEPDLTQLCLQDLRGHTLWTLKNGTALAEDYRHFLQCSAEHLQQPLAVVFINAPLARIPVVAAWLQRTRTAHLCLSPHNTAHLTTQDSPRMNSVTAEAVSPPNTAPDSLTHLQRLEAESIHIMREVVAEAEKPVMLYSIGKDSAVMLHLARKAFYPAPPPFPLLHVDTTWKFRAMYDFREQITKEYGLELIRHVNEEGVAQNVNPFTHGSALHTDIMKTQGLKQALDKHRFDFAFGGARRDEEKSRAKERVFSFRTAQHRWDAKNQRPELWHLYNARKHPGESIRVFPLSNWTELDIWQYIHKEDIPIVPLYLAAERPVVERDGSLIMVDDERMPLKDGEVPEMKSVRFRTLGCYPLTGAVESNANTLEDIIQEMLLTRTSERQGRMIDHDSAASMEKKKQEGYF